MNKYESQPSEPISLPREWTSAGKMKTLHVNVPYDAWLNARKAALDSEGMKFKEFIAKLLQLATPFKTSELEKPTVDKPTDGTPSSLTHSLPSASKLT